MKKDEYKSAELDIGKEVRIYDNKVFAKSPNSGAGYLFVLGQDQKPIKAIDLFKKRTMPKSVFRHYAQFVNLDYDTQEVTQ